MSAFRVGFIGTGKPGEPSVQGYAMAYAHGSGYERLGEKCEMVSCCDLVEERADAFAERFGIPTTYIDYRAMLEREGLDIVSVCTWPHLHEQMVMDCAEAGVAAVHCEKPMASDWGGARRMARVCAEKGVRLTFNHQRRFGKPFRTAKQLLDEGEIGKLRKMEFGSFLLFDYCSHQFDMCGYFNDQVPCRSVMAQIDYRSENLVFGVHNENESLALWQYANDVYGFCATGDLIRSHNRLVGTDGVIEVGPAGEEKPVLRIRRAGSAEWEAVDCDGETCHGPDYNERAVADVVRALQEGTTSELCAENALQATEIIFACYESSRRRGRVDLPLEIEDNPLEAMVASGELAPAKD
ncbi:MAG: Gfo/Idh/MocA family protein [Planctomycetota bacterium]|jgi:predicted dehydrogenase